MRPRALLNVTAICLLLAAATVWALPPPPEPPAAAAARKTSALGKTSLGNQPGKPAAEQKPAVAAAAAEKPKPANKPAAAAAAAEKPKPADKPAAAAAAAEKAAFAGNPQFELLGKVVPGLSPRDVSVVPGTVKRFSQEWEKGAKNPNRYLPEVRLNQRALLDRWENTPPKNRIFVIGSGEDFPKISERAQSLESKGYTVFFYKFCRPLCSSEAVGAMAGTSGQIMLYHTTSAELSKYVEVEVATARFREGLDKQVILISTEELLAGQFAMHVANMPTPTPSAVK